MYVDTVAAVRKTTGQRSRAVVHAGKISRPMVGLTTMPWLTDRTSYKASPADNGINHTLTVRHPARSRLYIQQWE